MIPYSSATSVPAPNIFGQRNLRGRGNELAVASLAILRELEASLAASQKALLARDLEGITQGTREQVRLQRALGILWGKSMSADEIGAPETALATQYGSEPDEFVAAAQRVLYLGRVQAALLARSQQTLKMISYLVAGPNATYEPPAPKAIGAFNSPEPTKE
jgi:hypothetical protein